MRRQCKGVNKNENLKAHDDVNKNEIPCKLFDNKKKIFACWWSKNKSETKQIIFNVEAKKSIHNFPLNSSSPVFKTKSKKEKVSFLTFVLFWLVLIKVCKECCTLITHHPSFAVVSFLLSSSSSSLKVESNNKERQTQIHMK